MVTSINLPDNLQPMDVMLITKYLETLGKNVNKKNLAFLAEISVKPNINDKLESKQTLIKNFI